MTRPRRRPIVELRVLAIGVLIAVAVIGLLAWPAATDGDDESNRSVPQVHSDDELPPATDAVELVVPSDDRAEAIDAPSSDAPEAVAAPVAYSGRIVDPGGRPIAGATVWLIPDESTLKAMGHPLGSLTLDEPPTADLHAALSLPSFPSSTSDDDGRFRLEAMLEPRADSSPTTAVGQRLFPELIARRDGSRPARHVCREPPRDEPPGGPPGAAVEVGDLVLVPGVAVSGRVIDEREQPLGDVDVVLVSIAEGGRTSGDTAQAHFPDVAQAFEWTRSSGDGRFRLDGLPPSVEGPLRVAFNAPGRNEAKRELTAGAGASIELGDVMLERGLAIAGRVVDERGQPLAGVPVRLTDEVIEGWEREAHTIELELLMIAEDEDVVGALGSRNAAYSELTTDEAGRFEIGGLDRRREYSAYASALGREPDVAKRLVAGDADVELRLVPRGSLALRLIEAHTSGTPVTDARVRVYRRMLSSFPNPLEIAELPVQRAPDDSSLYIVDGVCPAELGVLIESPSLGQHSQIVRGLALGAAREERVLEIPRGATIGGRVLVDPTGAPLPGAVVWLSAWEGQGPGALLDRPTVTTDESGAFRFEGLEAGSWWVVAQARGALDDDVEIVVKAGEVRLDLVLQLRLAGRFQGTVSHANGAPAEGVVIQVKEYAGAWSLEALAKTDASGLYVVDSPPGHWVLELSLEASAGSLETVAEGSVTAGQATTVDVTLPAPGRLSGRALSAARPVPDAQILARGPDGQVLITAGEDGTFDCEVAGDGEFVLVARSPRGGISNAAHVQLGSGGSAWAELIFGGRTLTGLVLDTADKRPIAGAAIELLATGKVEDQPPLAPRIVTDAEGAFVLEDVGSGDYVFEASHPDYSSPQGAPLTIGQGDQRPSITVEMQRATLLTGVVRMESGQPTGARLLVSAWRLKGGSEPQATSTLADDGTFRFADLPAGHYYLFVTQAFSSHAKPSRADYERIRRGWAFLEIKAGEDASAEITLRPDDE